MTESKIELKTPIMGVTRGIRVPRELGQVSKSRGGPSRGVSGPGAWCRIYHRIKRRSSRAIVVSVTKQARLNAALSFSGTSNLISSRGSRKRVTGPLRGNQRGLCYRVNRSIENSKQYWTLNPIHARIRHNLTPHLFEKIQPPNGNGLFLFQLRG